MFGEPGFNSVRGLVVWSLTGTQCPALNPAGPGTPDCKAGVGGSVQWGTQSSFDGLSGLSLFCLLGARMLLRYLLAG
jgi:hypothetical protein